MEEGIGMQLIQAIQNGQEQEIVQRGILPAEVVNQIKQALQQGASPEQLAPKVEQVIAQIQQGQAQMARRGAKLNYLKRLKNECPEGSHLVFKQGGKCPVCERNKAVAKGAMGMELDNQKKTISKTVDSAKKEIAEQKKKKKQTALKKPKTTSTPNPKDLKTLPGGKYPANWTAEQRAEWERLHNPNGHYKCGGSIKNRLVKKANGGKTKCDKKLVNKHAFGGIL